MAADHTNGPWMDFTFCVHFCSGSTPDSITKDTYRNTDEIPLTRLISDRSETHHER
jgi:hypothetical protein